VLNDARYKGVAHTRNRAGAIGGGSVAAVPEIDKQFVGKIGPGLGVAVSFRQLRLFLRGLGLGFEAVDLRVERLPFDLIRNAGLRPLRQSSNGLGSCGHRSRESGTTAAACFDGSHQGVLAVVYFLKPALLLI